MYQIMEKNVLTYKKVKMLSGPPIGVSIGALSVTHRLSSGSMDTAGYSKTW